MRILNEISANDTWLRFSIHANPGKWLFTGQTAGRVRIEEQSIAGGDENTVYAWSFSTSVSFLPTKAGLLLMPFVDIVVESSGIVLPITYEDKGSARQIVVVPQYQNIPDFPVSII